MSPWRRQTEALQAVNVSKSTRDMAVNCTRAGNLPAAQVVRAEFQAMTAGNILIGGVIGLGIDAASGAINKYDDEVTITMHPIRNCSR